MSSIMTPSNTDGRALGDKAFKLSCQDQFELATRIASNVGYVLVGEPSFEMGREALEKLSGDLLSTDYDAIISRCYEHGQPDYVAAADAIKELRAKLAAAPQPGAQDAVGEALRRLLITAKLLQQNSEGCAVNHHGLDFKQEGPPGWLIDTQKDIDAAAAALQSARGSEEE